LCVFAHPDDEAFGPSGTIAKLSAENEVFLVCVTDGNDQNNPLSKLAEIRKKELTESANILGIKKVFCLNYTDGELKNNIYHRVAADIEKIISKVHPDTLMTFELRGVSGHLDHVFCSLVASYLFRNTDYIQEIMYFAAHMETSKRMKDYFIYFPDGYENKDADLVIDISKQWDKKIAAIKAHKSQRNDVTKALNLIKKLPKNELFFGVKK